MATRKSTRRTGSAKRKVAAKRGTPVGKRKASAKSGKSRQEPPLTSAARRIGSGLGSLVKRAQQVIKRAPSEGESSGS